MAQASTGFQSQVSTIPAPGVEGDFNTLNPFYFFPAGPGGLVAGNNHVAGAIAGLVVGRWCWTENNYLDTDNAPTVVNNYASAAGGAPIGILPRRQQGLITTFLAEASMVVPTGLAVGVLSSGDVWAVNRGSGQALIGQKAYAAFADGSTSFAATGTPTTGASSSSTGSFAAETFSVTASVSGNVMTVTVVGSGTVYPGSLLTGGGTGTVSAQLSGTTGGVGTYALTVPEQSVASTTITGGYTLFTAGTVTGGTFGVGDVLTGSGVTAGSFITLVIAGGGTTGSTMVVSPYNQTDSGNTISVAATNVETAWYAQSSAGAGELIKISRTPSAPASIY